MMIIYTPQKKSKRNGQRIKENKDLPHISWEATVQSLLMHIKRMNQIRQRLKKTTNEPTPVSLLHLLLLLSLYLGGFEERNRTTLSSKLSLRGYRSIREDKSRS